MTYALCGAAAAADPVVWVGLADGGGAYTETAEAVRAELERSGTRVDLVVRPWRELLGNAEPPPRMIVAVGVAAMRGLADARVKAPLLATLVPRAAYVQQAATGTPAFSAIWLDQPAARLLQLVRLALPGQPRVGVLYGLESRLFELEFVQADASRIDMSIVGARVNESSRLADTLEKVIGAADVLVALPDPLIYNGNTLQNILTATYRRRIPLIGFSPAYVQAGALLGLYSTPAQLGEQCAETIRGVLAGRPLPAAQGPRRFTLGFNAGVARALGIAVDADILSRWTIQMQPLEHKP
jgi:ABC-type uncharacterized transport system substrate-binding protein